MLERKFKFPLVNLSDLPSFETGLLLTHVDAANTSSPGDSKSIIDNLKQFRVSHPKNIILAFLNINSI